MSDSSDSSDSSDVHGLSWSDGVGGVMGGEMPGGYKGSGAGGRGMGTYQNDPLHRKPISQQVPESSQSTTP